MEMNFSSTSIENPS